MDYLVLNLYATLHAVTTPILAKQLVTRSLVNAKHKDAEINNSIFSLTFVGPKFVFFNTLMQ